MASSNGAGLTLCGSGGEARKIVGTGKRDDSIFKPPSDSNQVSTIEELAAHIDERHRTARRLADDAVEQAAECGRLLVEAKSRVAHGSFLEWLAANTSVGARQAQKYMRLANRSHELPETNANSGSHSTINGALKLLATPARTDTFAVLSSSRSSQWYTPAGVVEQVTAVLGGIDLDPCWHPESPVKATTTYVEEQDGLSHDWHGRVYLNPPYGRPIDGWIEKLVGEHEAGRVTEAIALVPARVDTEWFRRLDAFPRCFLYGRVTFANADNPAPFPNAVIYLGKNVRKFADVFDDEQVGGVWVRLERPDLVPVDDGFEIPPYLDRRGRA